MIDWQDTGTILSMRPHGETSVIIDAFTAQHGRHSGVVRGGISRKIAPNLQPGTHVMLTWRARLDHHIGAYTVEPLKSRSAVLSDRLGLAGQNSVCALLGFTLAEREPHPTLVERTEPLFDAIATNEKNWTQRYMQWELALLDEIGYGLDLRSCAVTGARDDLAYVSPKTGRAVSRAGAGDWADRLLPLPEGLQGQGSASTLEVVQGLRITGHFLARFAVDSRPLPAARERFVEMLARLTPEDAAR
ncbi:DNA repair protein RecO [Albirhodobacter sp. R86504]|uniref:DNA repair protein RecO n=1 Tax=Albirhodobacter sp. R86504 TaxID=3093848 RepID=UPI00367013AB